MKKIPIKIAKDIAIKYGYEQVIILAQIESNKKDWVDGWVTTFNTNKSKCKFLGKIGAILIYNLRAFYYNSIATEEYYRKFKENNNG